ncbi:hypothetical protein ACLBUO_28495, partial [Pseudomonas aeruginosa]|uniref:hypothetical protein n=1 Tax=Pseudomonas aeruginosa TaxID=287 RepID=UPI003968FE4E
GGRRKTQPTVRDGLTTTEWPLRFLVMRGCRARLQRIATLDERLGDLEHAFKPDLDGTTSAKPASPPPERFKLAPLGSVVRKKECATSSLPDEQSSCAALEFCTDCAQ